MGWFAGTQAVWEGGTDEKAAAWAAFERLHAALPGPSTMTARTTYYRRGLALDDGSFAVLYDGVGQAAGGIMATVRQGAFERLGAVGGRSLFDWLSESFRCSRLDLAADDVRDVAVRPSALFGMLPAARSRSRPASWLLTLTGDGFEKLTVGARASERYLRCYTTAKRTGVRHELELKQSVARGAVAALQGGASLESVWAAEYGRMVRWPS